MDCSNRRKDGACFAEQGLMTIRNGGLTPAQFCGASILRNGKAESQTQVIPNVGRTTNETVEQLGCGLGRARDTGR